MGELILRLICLIVSFLQTEKDALLLARLVHSESDTTSMADSICRVVVNRASDSIFFGHVMSIEGVVFDNKFGTQFHGTKTKKFNETPPYILVKKSRYWIKNKKRTKILFFDTNRKLAKRYNFKYKVGNTNFYEYKNRKTKVHKR